MELRRLLNDLLSTGGRTNRALELLIDDYATYHLVLVVAGGVGTITCIAFAVRSFQMNRRAVRASGGRWTFEAKVHGGFSILAAIVGLGLGLLVLANGTNAANPRNGFADSINSIGEPSSPAGARLQASFTEWLEADAGAAPAEVEERVHSRLSWQRPKAVATTALTVLLAALSIRTWRALIRRSRHSPVTGSPNGVMSLATGVALVPCVLVSMVMAIANTQASIAPLTMTLLYG